MKAEILHIRIDEKLLKELKELADSNGLTVSSQVRMLIKKGVTVEK